MKKIYFIFALAIFCTPIFAENTEKNLNLDESLKQWGEQTKKLLEDTGEFLKNTGNEIENTVKDKAKTISEAKCYGTWSFKIDSSKMTVICNKDGTMEIQLKDGMKIDYWKGVFTVSLNTITFSVKEKGSKVLIKKESEEVDQNWLIFYFMNSEKNQMTLTSVNFPKNKDGKTFSGSTFYKE